jgi:GAF domain-containing protein
LALIAQWHLDGGAGIAPSAHPLIIKGSFALEPRYIEDANGEEADLDQIRAAIEMESLASLALLPIASGQRQIGILVLAADEHHVFASNEKRRLESLSDQLAVGLDRLDLTHQVQDSFRREQALREMMEQVRSAVDIEGVMRIAVQETGRLLGRSAFIHLGEPVDFGRNVEEEQNER